MTDVSTGVVEVTWMPARLAAEQADAGETALMPPTYLTSMEVGEHARPRRCSRSRPARSVEMFCPSIEPLGDGWTLSMPDRLRLLVAERRRACGGGRLVGRLVGRAFGAPGAALLAPNPRMMTLDGTNTWVLQEPGGVGAGRGRSGPVEDGHPSG